VVSGEQTRLFDASDTAVLSLAFSPEGRILASGGDAIRLRDSVSGQELRAFKGHITSVFAVAFSPDGKTLAAGSEKGRVYLWDLAGGQQVRFLEGHNDFLIKVAFSPDGSTLASGGADKIIRLWDVKSGKERFKLAGHNESVNDLAFSSDGQTLVSSSGDKTIKLWNVLTGQLRESMQWSTENEERAHQLAPTFTRGSEQMKNDEATSGNFLARTSPAGVDVFDRTGRTELCDLIVVDENDWLVVTPKGFFDGSPRAWKQVIWRLNGNTFSVVPVEAFFSDFFHPGLLQDIFNGEVPTTEIAISNKDIRQPQLKLSLNDESSVEQSASSVNRSVAVKVEIADAPAGARDVRLFRNGSLVRVWHGDVLKGQSRAAIYATIPVVAGENLFTAYAFNHDNVKSPDASMTAIGAASLKRQGMIYILAVGINQYANSQYNLKYAVADAQEFAEEFKRQQMKLNNYAAVKVIPLSDKNATRAAIRKSLDDLSREALPEDAVIVYFAGHGTAQGKRFYLIPHDLGYAGPRTQLSQTGLQSILAHSISDEELEASFENFHGGQLVVLVIDACNSGQVLEAEEKRRGPMNSKGLAQLAYEKGMYVLTAAQSYQAANEAARLGHGFLTYALVEEGLKAGAADGEPKDGQVLLREWLDFATERVPQMQQEELDAQKKAGHRQLERIKFAEADSGAERSLQRPRVFYRRETEMHPLVVARP
jgi:hypothetical protein